MKKNIQEIKISNIYLDEENARFKGDKVANQDEARQRMLEDPISKKKVINLSIHIAKHGLDLSELPLVFPGNRKKQFITAEGNRRILAIKLVHNPKLILNSIDRKKIMNVGASEMKKELEEIQCSVVSTRQQTDMWVELKHTGENHGVGRVTWDGNATAAFRLRQGKEKTAGRQILDYIENDPEFDSDLESSAKSIKITNLTRLFDGKPAKEALGIMKKDGILESAAPVDCFRDSLEFIINTMSKSNFSVKDIYHKDDQEKFIKKIPNSVLYDVKDPIGENWILSNFDPRKLTTEQKKGKSSTSNNKNKRLIRSKRDSSRRSYLIDFSLKINDKRVHAIYTELKRRLLVHDCPNAVSVLFRVFLELSCDYYLGRFKVIRKDNKKQLTRNCALKIKVEQITNHLEGKNILTSEEARVTRNLASGSGNINTVESFNAYIHSFKLAPIATELNLGMDNWSNFLKALWK